MKKLNGTDVFKFGRLLAKMNFKAEASKFADHVDNVSDAEGIQFIYTMLERLMDKNCEAAFWEFLSRPFEMTPEEVAELEISDLIAKLKELRDQNNLAPFFNFALRMIRSN